MSEITEYLTIALVKANGERFKWLAKTPMPAGDREKVSAERRLYLASHDWLRAHSFEVEVAVGERTLDEICAQHVAARLLEYNGNMVKCAKSLGVSRSTLYRYLDKKKEDAQ